MSVRHKVGLIDVDNTGFPNLALMKYARHYTETGSEVEWYDPFCQGYDTVIVSKVFSFSTHYNYELINEEAEVLFGGTGFYGTGILHDCDCDYPYTKQPLYDIYPKHDKNTAIGFLTRGCPNSCPWCVVPEKEGGVRPVQDIEEIMIEGRAKAVLMDNNILAMGIYAEEQLEKIIKNGYRIDFNQGLDARFVNDVNAELIAKVKWLNYIRFGCDTWGQIYECEAAFAKIRRYGYSGRFFVYSMIYGEIEDCAKKLEYWRDRPDVVVFAQPFRPIGSTKKPPQWMRDMARWCNRKQIYKSTPFFGYKPRKNAIYRQETQNF